MSSNELSGSLKNKRSQINFAIAASILIRIMGRRTLY